MVKASFKSIVFFPLLGIPLAVATCFLLVPCLPLLYLKPTWFRWCVDHIGAFFQVHAAAVIELAYGIKYRTSGDLPAPGIGNNLIIMNHRTRLDWLFFWVILARQSFRSLVQHKITLQHPLKFLPIIGAPCQFAGYIFLDKADFSTGKFYIKAMLDLHKTYSDHYNVLFFPEGTDLCDEAITKSKEYASRNDLPIYDYVVHPRVNGFAYLVSTMMKEYGLESVYDVTVAYRPESHVPQTELDIIRGCIPDEVHFHTKRYHASDMPTDEQGLQDFCKQRWKEKEQTLREFYGSDRSLNSEEFTSTQSYKPMLIFSSAFWLSLSMLIFSTIFTAYYLHVLVYVAIANAILSYFNWVHNGLDAYQSTLLSK